jgi:hypothetical protein
VNDGVLVEVVDEAILEFLLGGDADVAQHGAGEFGKEALDEVEPGAVLGREGEFEAARGLLGEPGSGLFGDVRCALIPLDSKQRPNISRGGTSPMVMGGG